MANKEELIAIVGKDNVFDISSVLDKYSRDQSFVRRCKPNIVVKPKSLEEVQAVIRKCNKDKIPVTPYSSGLNLRGAAIPDQGGVVLDLSGLDKIEEINEKDRLAVIEPGVTYEKLQDELTKRGYRAMVPWGVPPKRSVLSSYLERDPVLAAASFEYGNDLFLDMEMVLPTGEVFRTGNWGIEGGEAGSTWGPIGFINYRFWTGAQGTFGVITKLALKIEPLPQVRKLFFFPFDSLEAAIVPLRKVQRRELGLECFGLDRFSLAALLEEAWEPPDNFPCEKVSSTDLEALRQKLAPWTFLICLSGLDYFPEDKVSYEESVLREVCAEENVEPLTSLPGLPELEEIFLETLIYPWRKSLKKFRYKGSCHNIAFHSPLAKIPELEGIIRNLAERHGYPTRDIGGYLLPIERGRAIYGEFDFPCDQEDQEETELVKRIWNEASEALMDKGAYFARPYGRWADMIYSRYNTAHVSKLKDLKREIDPNNIMNPGKLCF